MLVDADITCVKTIEAFYCYTIGLNVTFDLHYLNNSFLKIENIFYTMFMISK